MTWILANPLLSLVIAISLALSVLCGVQSIRIKSLKADVLVAEARLERMRVDLDAQSQLVRQWAARHRSCRAMLRFHTPQQRLFGFPFTSVEQSYPPLNLYFVYALHAST